MRDGLAYGTAGRKGIFGGPEEKLLRGYRNKSAPCDKSEGAKSPEVRTNDG